MTDRYQTLTHGSVKLFKGVRTCRFRANAVDRQNIHKYVTFLQYDVMPFLLCYAAMTQPKPASGQLLNMMGAFNSAGNDLPDFLSIPDRVE